jgi:hypothetical protein
MANNLRYGYSPFYSEDTCGSNEEDENEQYWKTTSYK